jgi:hypothetical protein
MWRKLSGESANAARPVSRRLIRRLGLGEEFAAATRRHQQDRYNAVWPRVLLDRAELAREYATKSIRQIAREQGTSSRTVARALRLHDLPPLLMNRRGILDRYPHPRRTCHPSDL